MPPVSINNTISDRHTYPQCFICLYNVSWASTAFFHLSVFLSKSLKNLRCFKRNQGSWTTGRRKTDQVPGERLINSCENFSEILGNWRLVLCVCLGENSRSCKNFRKCEVVLWISLVWYKFSVRCEMLWEWRKYYRKLNRQSTFSKTSKKKNKVSFFYVY